MQHKIKSEKTKVQIISSQKPMTVKFNKLRMLRSSFYFRLNILKLFTQEFDKQVAFRTLFSIAWD